MKVYECIVFWHGFPACGHMLKDLSNKLGASLKVYATRPVVPFDDMGQFLSNKIEYLNNPDDLWNYFDVIKLSKIFIHTGWNFHKINKIDFFLHTLKIRPKIYILVDNRLKYTAKQFIGAIYYRIILRHLYDGVIVAGLSSFRLMRFLGEKKSRISSGHYGASNDLYPRWNGGLPKKKQFMFVGSLDKRKGIDLLVDAWRSYKKDGGTWSLKVYGSGPLDYLFDDLTDASCYGFAQPSVISNELLQSFAFILPSRDDNWGTVVAEAAASGCALITTSAVGAALDLINHRKNGFIVSSLSSSGIYDAIKSIVTLTDNELIFMCMNSVEISQKFDSSRLTNALEILSGKNFNKFIIN